MITLANGSAAAALSICARRKAAASGPTEKPPAREDALRSLLLAGTLFCPLSPIVVVASLGLPVIN
ncbi:hypothetical protein HY024_01525 [Candidatus Curtissbacteria bacterium]|nr:hypothetical protein [Candidatus Curtissbacteria bacterium]